MPRTAATPEQRQQVRRKIRRAAAEIYAENGIMGVSVRAIAKRAGISTGTLYSYYANLQDLMRSLWQAPVAKSNLQLQEVAKAHSEPTERIRALLEAYMAFAFENEDTHRGALLFVRPTNLPSPKKRPLTEQVFHQLLRTAIQEGQAQGLNMPWAPAPRVVAHGGQHA
ncbi:MAG: TetR family transcriptional regulator [Pseudomonadota bacterium]